jgi:serine/threonine protein kinase
MPLSVGTRLGPYEVVSAIGAGGMGEVYRARDTRLDREVAVKIVPELFASDPDRLLRFEREAKTLASLNHPNIAQIHGIEGADIVRALVMEYIDGEDLSQRIARGPLPLDEALPIAASSIATSSRRTSRSARTAPSRCSTSACRRRSIRARRRPISANRRPSRRQRRSSE